MSAAVSKEHAVTLKEAAVRAVPPDCTARIQNTKVCVINSKSLVLNVCSALDGGERLVSRPGHFIPGNKVQHQSERRLDVSQNPA